MHFIISLQFKGNTSSTTVATADHSSETHEEGERVRHASNRHFSGSKTVANAAAKKTEESVIIRSRHVSQKSAVDSNSDSGELIT